MISGLSITYRETLVFFGDSLSGKIAALSHAKFAAALGDDLVAKLPNLAISALNLTLIYLTARATLRYPKDALLCALIYAALPCVLMQGALLNETTIPLFFALLICYIEAKWRKIAYPIVFLAVFLGANVFMLFLALFFFAIYRRNAFAAGFSLFCLALNFYLFGIDISGKPRGEFLGTIGELAALYSPLIFVYFAYALYRAATIKRDKNLLLFVGVTSIAVGVFVSLRQEAQKEVFLFMSLCGFPLCVGQFLSDIRLRIPQFQNAYKRRFYAIALLLFIESAALIFAKNLYATLPSMRFLEGFFIVREVSERLKEKGIHQVIAPNDKLQKRFEFYGIERGGRGLSPLKNGGEVVVEYCGRVVARYGV